MSPSRERGVWLERHVLPHKPALRAWLGGRYLKGLEIDDIVQETYARLAKAGSLQHVRSAICGG
jgi:RNA polymerase sigma-70 factor (ECF subfamily)